MDDWALATAIDLDDRTRISGQQTIADRRGGRRRTRRATLRSSGAALGADGLSPEVTSGRSRTAPPTTGRLVWGISAAAALLVALVGAGVLAVLQGNRSIPVVTDVQATVDGTAVTFSWNDPGLEGGDAYIVTTNGQPSPLQRDPLFAVTADEGDRVCATVTVTRDGKSGAPSAESCVDVEVVIE